MVSRAIVQFIALFPRLARSGSSSTGRQIAQTIPQFSINYFHYGILWYIFGIFGIFANSFVSYLALFSIDVKLTVDFNFELFAIPHTHTHMPRPLLLLPLFQLQLVNSVIRHSTGTFTRYLHALCGHLSGLKR